MIIDVYNNLTSFFSIVEKRHFNYLMLLSVVVGFLDFIGIASVVPFLYVLTDQSILENNQHFGKILSILGSKETISVLEFQIKFGVICLAVFLTSIILKSLHYYLQIKFALDREASISEKLLKHYLNLNYEWYLQTNSTELGSKLLSEVSYLINSALLPYIRLITSIITSIVIFAVMLLMEPLILFVLIVIFGSYYSFVFYFLRKKIKDQGIERLKSNKSRFEIFSNIFFGIKEIKLYNNENIYLNNYKKNMDKFVTSLTAIAVLSNIPKFFIEGLAFASILLITIYGVYTDNSNTIAFVLTFAIAGYRLLPIYQQIYSSLAELSASKESIDNLLKIYNESTEDRYYVKKDYKNDSSFTDKLVNVENMSFKYKNSLNYVFENINISFNCERTNAIIAPSGMGKSTFLDLITGLIHPTSGSITKLKEDNLGYVSQNVFILDNSLKENICYNSEDSSLFDFKLYTDIIEILDLSTLDNDKKMSYLGENGKNISGGQRQRVGIGRALYKNPNILILDEATSGLNKNLESDILRKIKNYFPDLIIILVTHRIHSVVDFENIIYIKDKNTILNGNFQELCNDISFNMLVSTSNEEN